MAELNLLIGNGETLVGAVKLTRGPSSKAYPYSIQRARERLSPTMSQLGQSISIVPKEARPGEQGVAMVTVHPAFMAKSYLPEKVLRRAGLRTVGSRLTHVTPEHDARQSVAQGPLPATDLYVAGTPSGFNALHELLLSEQTPKNNKDELRRIELVSVLAPEGRVGYIEPEVDELVLEAALHMETDAPATLQMFSNWVSMCGGETRLDKRVVCRGLVFLPVRLPRTSIHKLAQFSLLRVVRTQPQLRCSEGRSRFFLPDASPTLPNLPPISAGLTTAIFDGGVAHDDFAPWASEHISVGTEATNADHLDHGTAVTSAFLFGTVKKGMDTLPVPYTAVDHYRVITPADQRQWYDLNDVLNRIKQVLTAKTYDFVNLSLGPQVEVDDGFVHAWTSTLDELLSNGKTMAVVAAGNVPDSNPDQEKIQPPADAVNALAVGTANSDSFMWDRDSSSCIGPGRSPGLVKPDGLAYSGSPREPVRVQGGIGEMIDLHGATSFGAPLVLRLAAGLRAVTEFPLVPTAPRALLIHHAERSDRHDWRLVGWGRFPDQLEQMLITKDSTATVIYQGEIRPGQPLRARIPLPDGLSAGRISIKATFCFVADVDPAHPINYTRSGLIIVFRPRLAEKQSLPFFSSGALYSTEEDWRQDAHKWETVLKRSRVFDALDLQDPLFDIEYQTRERGVTMADKNKKPLPYVLVVTVSTDQDINLYDRVLQKYPTLNPVRVRQDVRLRS